MPGWLHSGGLRAAGALLLVLAGSFQGRCNEPRRWPAVSAELLRRHVTVLGSDALEGRAPGSRGGTLAADYIARELDRSGAAAFGEEGSFFQQVPLVATTPLPGCRLELVSFGHATSLELGRDYLLASTGSQTWLPRPVPLVFVGYGIVAPEFDHNDYADVDVRGKIAVICRASPPRTTRTISWATDRRCTLSRRPSSGSPSPGEPWAACSSRGDPTSRLSTGRRWSASTDSNT